MAKLISLSLDLSISTYKVISLYPYHNVQIELLQ